MDITANVDRKKVLVIGGKLKKEALVYMSCDIDGQVIKPKIYLQCDFVGSKCLRIELGEFGRAVLSKYKTDYNFLFELYLNSDDTSILDILKTITAKATVGVSHKLRFTLRQNAVECDMTLIRLGGEDLLIWGHTIVDKKTLREFFENSRFVK